MHLIVPYREEVSPISVINGWGERNESYLLLWPAAMLLPQNIKVFNYQMEMYP
jgi:hypothetical protein